MRLERILEDFGTYDPATDAKIELSDVALEEKRLESFEQGYKAGWDDAIKAQGDDQTRVAADFARNMQDLSFTYHDAFNQLTKALQPLLTQVVEKVLPDLAHATLGMQVVEQITDIAKTQAGQPVEIVVSPINAKSISALAEQELGMPIAIVEEASLGEGQVFLRFGQVEREINLDQVLGGISDAVDAFFHQTEQEMNHG
ncbi:MAG: hypothetical protein ABJV68_28760 [Paracoccaceae bacterium]